MNPRISILLPAVLLAFLVFWCGTLPGAASATGALSHQAAALLFCLLAPRLWDPLDLGSSGRWLLAAVIALVAVGWWFSPVGRAGLVGLALLPAYLLLPASTAHCWREPRFHRAGLTSLSLLTLSVALVALIRWQSLSLPRASLPLGHHNLLAGWLVLMLPLALAALRFPGAPRYLAIGAGTTALLTLAATGSLLGALAVALQGTIALLWRRRLRFWLVSGALGLGVLVLPRLISITQAADLSTLARLSYIEAGWRGLRVRPTLGWGPGAVPWTLGEFMRPAAGIHPPSQVVGDLHSLPVQVAYEIGIPGLILIAVIVVVFFLRRREELRGTANSIPQQAALLGLLGGVVFALGSSPLAVPALPATAAVVAGLTLRSPKPALIRHRAPWIAVYLLVAMTVLLPLDRGHFLYEAARRAADPAASLRHLDQARRLDADFPLYLARRAWLASDTRGVDREAADQAREAAEMAPGLAPLWLAAGDLGRRAHQAWAPSALAHAYRLDPLSPLAAFHLMMVQGNQDEAVRLGEAAVAMEPRLVGAQWWWSHRDLADRLSRRIGVPIPEEIDSPSAEPMVLALTLDRTPSLSFSLYAFRRSPWPGRMASISLATDRSGTPHTSVP